MHYQNCIFANMKCGVVIFPGSNCDQDMIYVLRNIMKHEVVELWHKDSDLQNCELIVLPGGFSYGDYLRSGAIARFSPIMEQVINHANNGGLLFGVCNGFQILCEAGLLPGTLLHNESHKFICKNVYVKPQNNNTVLTRNLSQKDILTIPIAHAEGKYFANKETLEKLTRNNQILFTYCSENGETSKEYNPNGSLLNIAGVCNKNKNVFGMMPHPERASDEELNNISVKRLFEGLLENALI